MTAAIALFSGIAGVVATLAAVRVQWRKDSREQDANERAEAEQESCEAERVRDLLKQQAELVARNVSLEYEIKMKERDEAHAREMTDFRRSMIREMEKRVEEAVERTLDLKGCELVGTCDKRVKPGLGTVRI